MAEHGGKRPNAGRPPGRKNRATQQMKMTLEELAREHTDTAIQTLIAVCVNGETDGARVSAANALLDRGYGKPKQGMELSGPNGGPIATDATPNLTELLRDAPPDVREWLRKSLEK